MELSLDFSIEVDELPNDAEVALEVEEVDEVLASVGINRFMANRAQQARREGVVMALRPMKVGG